MNCIFCKIIAGEIPAQKLYEDDATIAIRDINSVAPHHILVMPKKHCPSIHEVDKSEVSLLGKVMETVSTIVKQEKLDKAGYRLVINAGEVAGQTVPHLHVHVLGGRAFAWPPG